MRAAAAVVTTRGVGSVSFLNVLDVCFKGCSRSFLYFDVSTVPAVVISYLHVQMLVFVMFFDDF